MKKSVYSVVLGAASLLALTACMQTVQGDAPGELNRKKVLWLRGDGMAIQRYEGCTRPANMHGNGMYGDGMDGENRWKHHRHHHHGMKAKAEAAKAEAKADAKATAKKEDVKKEEKKSDKKDSK